MSYLTSDVDVVQHDIYVASLDMEGKPVIENTYLIVFGAGVGSGIWASAKFCALLNSVRTPRYYQRRARRLARGAW